MSKPIQEHDDQLSPVDGMTWPHGDGGTADKPNSGGVRGAEADGGWTDEEVQAFEAVRTDHRRLLGNPAANVDNDSRPHFLRIVSGEPDVCGQCGRLWPCPTYSGLAVPTVPPGE